MRIAYASVLAGTLGLMVGGVWVGCSSTDNTPGSPSTGDDGGGAADQFVPVQDSAGGGNDSAPTTDSAPAGDAGPTLSCTTYCTTILAACGSADGGVGGNAQYYDTANCMSTCALFAPGTYGESANSLGCRQYHADLATTGPAVHCPHAGAGGGGLCGARCDDYCSLAMAHCATAADPPYLTNADCMSACTAYPYEADASDYDPTLTSTLNCLDYHLRESFGDIDGQGIDGGHCDDLSVDGGLNRGACHPN